MIRKRPIGLLLCLLLIVFALVKNNVQGQSAPKPRLKTPNDAPDITITPNAQPIKLYLDANGNYTVKLSDVATVKGANIAKTIFNPTSFNYDDVGNQIVTVTAYDNYDPRQ